MKVLFGVNEEGRQRAEDIRRYVRRRVTTEGQVQAHARVGGLFGDPPPPDPTGGIFGSIPSVTSRPATSSGSLFWGEHSKAVGKKRSNKVKWVLSKLAT